MPESSTSYLEHLLPYLRTPNSCHTSSTAHRYMYAQSGRSPRMPLLRCAVKAAVCDASCSVAVVRCTVQQAAVCDAD